MGEPTEGAGGAAHGAAGADRVSGAMAALWSRFRGAILERLELLEALDRALLEDDVAPGQPEAAAAAAHKLAGALGTFGLPRGSELAREVELLLDAEPRPSGASRARYGELVAALRALLDATAEEPGEGSAADDARSR